MSRTRTAIGWRRGRGTRVEDRRRGRRIPGATLVAAAALAAIGGPSYAVASERPTRADLAAMQRRAARLESEYALASTRRPYIVLDLESGTLRYRLMGMTMREIPIGPVDTTGLVAESDASGRGEHLAGIFTMAEKEGDPRLDPLTPEEVEAGADDENVAAVFPPEPPKRYRVSFRQPIAILVSGQEEGAGVKGVWGRVRDLAARLLRRGDSAEVALRIAFRLDPATASEFWRSIVPDQRWLVIPPEGLVLPQAGQEPPPKPKAPRKAPAPAESKPKPPGSEEGVPFRIPPPVEPPGPNGDNGVGPPAPETPPETPPEETPEPTPDPSAPPPPDDDDDDGGGTRRGGTETGGTPGMHRGGGALPAEERTR